MSFMSVHDLDGCISCSATLDRVSMSTLLNDYAVSWSWQLAATEVKVLLRSKKSCSVVQCPSLTSASNSGSSVDVHAPVHRSQSYDFVERGASLEDQQVQLRIVGRICSLDSLVEPRSVRILLVWALSTVTLRFLSSSSLIATPRCMVTRRAGIAVKHSHERLLRDRGRDRFLVVAECDKFTSEHTGTRSIAV